MVEEPASQQPDKERERLERLAARQKLLDEKAAARQQRIEVRFLCILGTWLYTASYTSVLL